MKLLRSSAKTLRSLFGRAQPAGRKPRPIAPAGTYHLHPLEGRIFLTAVSWVAPGAGFWDVASNWSNNAVPTANDAVTIGPAGITVTVRTGDQLAQSLTSSANLSLTGGTLTLSQASQIDGTLTIDNQTTLNTNGPLAVNGALTLVNFSKLGGTGTVTANAGGTFSSAYIEGTFLNKGNIAWTSGNLNIDGTLTNSATGTLTATSTGSMPGPGTFSNDGTFVSDPGTYPVDGSNYSDFVTATFNNTGTVHVKSSAFRLRNSGTSSGIFNTDSGALLSIDGATNYQLAPGAEWDGAGQYEVTNFSTVTLQSTVDITPKNLALNGYAHLTGAGKLTLASGSTTNWSTAYMDGTGTTLVESGAIVTISDAVALDTRLLDNHSQLLKFLNGSLQYFNGGVIHNESDGEITISLTSTAFHTSIFGVGATNNDGLITVSDGGLYANFDSPLNNNATGTVHVTLGDVSFSNGGTSAGIWNVDANASVSYYGDVFGTNFTFNAGTAFDGSGTYRMAAGYRGYPLTVSAGADLHPLHLQVINGTQFVVNGTITIPTGGDLTTGGQLTSIQGTGSVVIDAGGKMNVGTTAIDELTMTGFTITNNGALSFFGDMFSFDVDSTINNNGSFVVQTGSATTFNGFFNIGSYGVLNNVGTFTISDPNAKLTLQAKLNNSGQFNVNAGQVTIYDSTYQGATSDGTFTVAAGASLTFGSEQTFHASTRLEGAGQYAMNNSANLILADAAINLSPLNFQMTSGKLSGAGQFTVPAGSTFLWTGGVIGNANFTVQSGATVVAAGFISVDTAAIHNAGTFRVTGDLALSKGASFDNQATGELRLQAAAGDTFVLFNTPDVTGAFFNEGQFTVVPSLPNGQVYIQFPEFSNTGTIEVLGGKLTVVGALDELSMDGFTLTGGTWVARKGANIDVSSVFNVSNFASTVILDGPTAQFSALTSLTENDGSITLLNGASLSTYPFNFVPLFTNAGSIEIDDNSVLRARADFTQTSTGSLIMHVGAGAAQLQVAGLATLGGLLAVQLEGGFKPVLGAKETLLTYASVSGDFASVQGVGPIFSAAVNPANYQLTIISTSLPDLQVSAVTGPNGPLAVGDPITIHYTVTDIADAPTVGDWTDAVYLSPGTTFDPMTAVLVGTVAHAGGLSGHASFQGTFTGTVPSLATGSYSIIVVADSHLAVLDGSRDNNSAASAQPVAVAAPKLTPGTPIQGTIANGALLVYELDLQGDSQVVISLTTAFAAGAEIFVRYGAAPTPFDFDESAFNLTGTGSQIILPGGAPGPYFIVVRGRESSGNGQAFTLQAADTVYGISSIGPSSGNGVSTITLHGSQFSPGTAVQLVPSSGTGATLTPISFHYTDNTTIAATFDFTGIAAGTAYDVVAVDGGASSTAVAAFTVGTATATANPVTVTISAPALFRASTNYTIQVNYHNVSGHDALPPLIVIAVTNALLRIDPTEEFVSPKIDFLGINTSGGPAGILPPGYQGSFTVEVQPNPGLHVKVGYSTTIADPNLPFDIATVTPYLPSQIYTPAKWAAIVADLQSRLGSTQAGYLAALSREANRLPASEGDASSPIDLLDLEVRESEANISTSIRGIVSSSSSGIQLAGRLLHALNTDTGDTFVTAVFNDGSFTFPTVTPGDYTFSLDGALLTSSDPAAVAANQHVTGLALTATRGATILGKTRVAETGALLADVSVKAISSTGVLYRATSDAGGAYRFDGLPADTYTIVADADGKARFVQASVTLTTSGLMKDFSLSAEAVLFGTVTPGTAANLIITARSSTNPDETSTFNATTDAHGAFTLTNLPAGQYILTIRADGYLTATLANVNATGGARTSVGSVLLVAASSITGKVTSDDPSAPISGMNVGAYAGGTLIASARADASGKYTITGLAAGTYLIQSIDAAYIRSSTSVTVAAGKTASSAALAVHPGGTIKGVLTDSTNGQPLANVAVLAVDANGNTFTGLTDSAGAYAILHLALGAYQVSAGLDGANALANATVTTLSPTPVVANLKATASAKITGQLLLADQITAATSGLVLLLQNGNVIATATTDTAGNFSFLLQQAGTYDLQAAAGDASFAPMTGLTVAAGGNLIENFIAGADSLALTVTDSTQAVTGSLVALIQVATKQTVGFATLDATGLVTFTNLAAGSYRLVVLGNNNRDATADVTVSSGVTTTSVAQVPFAVVTGSVASAGTPVGGATVALYSTTSPDQKYFTATAADGTYQVRDLPAGTYDLVIYAPGLAPAVQAGVTVNLAGTVFTSNLAASTESVTGTVKNAAGVALAGALVTLSNGSGEIVGQALSDKTGKFTLPAATGVGYSVAIAYVGHATNHQSISLTAGQALSLGSVSLAASGLGTQQGPRASGVQTLAFRHQVDGDDSNEDQAFGTRAIELGKMLLGLTKGPIPDPPTCDECQSAYDAALMAAQKRDDFLENTLKKDAANLLKDGPALIAAFYADRAIFTNKAAIVTATLALVEAQLALPVVATVVADTEAIHELLLGAFETIHGLFGFIKSLAEAKEQEDLRVVLADYGYAVVNAVFLFKGLRTLGDLETLSKTVFTGGASGTLTASLAAAEGILTALASSFTLTLAQAVVTAIDFKKGLDDLAEYNKLKDDAAKKLQEYEDCQAKHSQDCGNDGGGGGSGPHYDFPPPSEGLSGHDPNDLLGPAGVGAQKLVPVTAPLNYTVQFENDAKADAATAKVVVTNQLDANLDLSTFTLGSFGFGGRTFAVPAGRTSYHTVVDDTSVSGFDVIVDASLNVQTRTVTWTFTTIDARTGQAPADPLAGFLPPNVASPHGEGFVNYSAQPKSGLTANAAIAAQASIVFDANDAIATPVITNHVDNLAPSSNVQALPAQGIPGFDLSWSGVDPSSGSGVASYDIYVSKDGGAFQPFLTGTTRTTAVFDGEAGHSYGFYSVATDLVGNRQATPASAQATTMLTTPITKTIDAAHPFTFMDAAGKPVTIKLGGPGSAIAILEGGVATGADLRSLALSGTTVSTTISITVSSGTAKVGRIFTTQATESLASITLGKGLTLGSGRQSATAALTVTGSLKSLTLDGVAAGADIELGSGLNVAGRKSLHPTLRIGTVSGDGVIVNVQGGLGVTTVGSWAFAGSLNASGAITSLTVTGTMSADVTAGSLGNLTVGSLVNSDVVLTTGGLGNVTANQGILTGDTITATQGKVGNITARRTGATGTASAISGLTVNAIAIGNLTASIVGTGTLSAISHSDFTTSAGGFGNVSVTASGTGLLLGLDASSFTTTGGSIGNVTATVSSTEAGTFLRGLRNSLFTSDGKLGNITISATGKAKTPTTGTAIGIEANTPTGFQAGTTIGNVNVTAQGAGAFNIGLGGATQTPIAFEAGGSIGTFKVTASKGKNASSTAYGIAHANVSAGGTLGVVTVTGNATTTQVFDLHVYAGRSIAGLNVNATTANRGSVSDSTFLAGQLVTLHSLADLTAAGIGSVKISGAFFDDQTHTSTIAAVGNIGAVTFGDNFENARLVAGLNAGADRSAGGIDDHYNRAASITSVTVGGALLGSSIVAGVAPGDGSIWGGASDAAGDAVAGLNVTGKIGAIVLGASTLTVTGSTPLGSPAIKEHTRAIEALKLTSIKIGRLSAITAFATDTWIDANQNGTEETTEILVRLLD